MKGFFKLFPAALAALALASCSTDELENQSKEFATSEKGDLIVSVDPFNGFDATRAMRPINDNGKPGSLNFEDGDIMNVYDEELYKHDVYVMDGDAFYREGKQVLTDPKYGLFPGDQVVRGYWNKADEMTYAEFAIPHVITYDESSEQKIDGKMYYAANLPMFGYAELNGAKKVNVSHLRHLCAVIQLNLKDVAGNANWLRLTTAKKKVKLAGTFVAKLDPDPANREKVALQEGLSDLITYNEIFIDLNSVPSRESMILIPVVPQGEEGFDANAEGIRLDYLQDLSVKTEEDVVAVPEASWTNTGLKFPKEKFYANDLKQAEWTYSLTAMTPNKISTLLNQYAKSDADINFELADNFTINGDLSIWPGLVVGKKVDVSGIDATQAGRTIAIPALGVDVNVTLGKKFTAWNNASNNALRICDADQDAPFTGKFTLNVSDIYAAATTKDATPLIIDLPEAEIDIVGDWTPSNTEAIQVIAAKTLKFGDGTTATTVGSTATVFTLGAVDNLEVAAKTKLTTAGIAETATTPVNIDVAIAGQVEGDLNLGTSYNATLTMTTGKITDENDIVLKGNVTFGGDAEIALTSEAEAISGTLTMTGAKSKLKLKQGYINTLALNIANAGSWENKYINVILNEQVTVGTAQESRQAILAMTFATDNVAKFTESIWDGNAIKNTTYKGTYTNDGYAASLYTASQLASLTTGIGSDVQLKNDLNLNNKAWTGYQISKKFTGMDLTETRITANADTKYPVISGLALKANKGQNGLFSMAAAAMTISNITIDGVTATHTAAVNDIGAVFGLTNADVTIDNVIVKGINIVGAADKAMSYVGGLVGLTGGALTLNKVSAAGTIDGYKALGGFVGFATTGEVKITEGKSEVTIAQSYNSGKVMDVDYAMIGGFVGSATTTGKVLTVDAKSSATAITHNKADLEFVSDVDAGQGNFYKFTPAQTYIGYCGAGSTSDAYTISTSGVVKVGATNYALPVFKNDAVAAGTSKLYDFKTKKTF